MVGLAATLLGVGLAYRFRSARQGPSPTAPLNLPSGVDQQVSGFTFTRSDQERQLFTIHAARTEATKAGRTTVLEDVVVEVFGRKSDRRDVLRTHRAEYNSRTGGFLSPGATQIELNPPSKPGPVDAKRSVWPVYLQTSGVSYRPQGSLLVTEDQVQFRLGLASGSARGMVYATKDSRVELNHDVRAEWRTPGSAGPAAFTASRLYYDKQTGKVELGGPLVFSRGVSRLTAASGIITLDSLNRLARADLDGSVRASDESGNGERARSATVLAGHLRGDFDPASTQLRTAVAEGGIKAEIRRGGAAGQSGVVGHGGVVEKTGSLASLEAENGEIVFGGVHSTPKMGDVAGNIRLTLVSSQVAGSSAPETKVLSARQLDFSFRPDGQSVDKAQTVGEGKLTLLPQDPKQGEREITAGQFVMAFDDMSRLTNLAGRPGARLKFHPPPGTPPGIGERESSSEAFEARLNPSTEALEAFEQTGQFAFTDGERQASAARAQYSPGLQLLTLTGHPQMWDEATRTKSERVMLHLDTGSVEGIGKVEATHIEPGDPTPQVAPQVATRAAPQAPRAGGLGAGSDPSAVAGASSTHVLADRVRAEKSGHLVHYEGHVRAWHGADVIESASLDYHGNERRLSSGSSVFTSHLAPSSRPVARPAASPVGGSARASAPGIRPLTIRADHLEFFDEGRKADYRGNVELETESTTMRSDRMDVYFSPAPTVGGSQVEHVVAEGHVRVDQPQRRATGDHADYEATAGKIVLKGGPPSLYDEEKGFTTGQSLTFFIHDDRLSVDGGAESPTLSKGRVAQ